MNKYIRSALGLIVALTCLVMSLPASAQQRTVQGTVVDSSGEPMIGAYVQVTGSPTRGTITGAGGAFSIQAASNETLTVTFLGYQDAVVPASSTNLVITMQESIDTLDEIVVVGYGTQRKATLTGAVSSVNNKEIAVTKNENVVNMLSGKIPGVRITQSSSQPGNFEDTKIDIRGMGRPLIVVDGVPRDQGYFSRMDANEIEQVSVLKDASAAIYGVEAANGVLLVTTKRGRTSDGKFNINFSANYGWQNFLYVPETADAATNMLLINEKIFNNIGANYPVRTSPRYTWEQMLDYSTGKLQGTNWANEIFRKNVPQQQYNISMDGGSDKVSYFFNVGYLDQQGSYKSGSLNYHRWNFRSNIDLNITKRLKASVQLGGYIDEKNSPGGDNDMWTIYKKAWTFRPTAKAWLDEEHTVPAFDPEWLDSEPDNPVATTNSRFFGYDRDQNTNLDGSLSLTYDIPGVKGLSAQAFYNYSYYTTNNTRLRRQYNLYQEITEKDGTKSIAAAPRNTQPYLQRRTDPGYSELMKFQVNYMNNFGDHNVNALLAYEERKGYVDGFYAQRAMLLDGEYLMYGENADQVAAQGNLNDWARKALLGRVNYDWKGRYLAEFAFRYDGSSKFAKQGTWGFFPSASVGWRISEENFVKDNISFLTNLKLRLSYGLMGDDAEGRRAVMGYLLDSDNIGWFYDGAFMGGVKPSETPNLDLTWYIAKTFNVGLDFDLWNGKLSGTLEFFQRNRSGLLVRPNADVSAEVGALLPQVNMNSDKTFGWEIMLGHRNRVGGVDYWVNGQISATKNRWDYRLDTEGSNSLSNYRRKDVSGRNKDIWFNDREEGGRFSNYEGIRYHFLPPGQNALPGDYWYEDWNGDGVINGDDEHPVATFQLPVFNYGISIGASWKGIDFSMNWQGAAGVYSQYGEVFSEIGPFNNGAVLDIYTDRWHTVNPDDDPWNPNTQWIEGYYPASGHSFSDGTSGIRNASYIRLKTLEVGYTLPRNWLEKVGVQGLRVYVNAYNLLTFTGLKNIDPERPGARGSFNDGEANNSIFYRYPVNRTFNIGATLKF